MIRDLQDLRRDFRGVSTKTHTGRQVPAGRGVCLSAVREVVRDSRLYPVRFRTLLRPYVSVLQFLIEAHHSEGNCCDLLVHHKHEGCSQDRLQELGLQTFVQSYYSIPLDSVH